MSIKVERYDVGGQWNAASNLASTRHYANPRDIEQKPRSETGVRSAFLTLWLRSCDITYKPINIMV